MDEFVRRALEPSTKSAGAYFRRQWLTRTTRSLAEVRRAAGLTQAEVAAKMGTTQSAIARLENDLDGGTSLRRYVDFLLACDVVPLLPETKALNELREAGLKDPSVSPLDVRRWLTPHQSAELSGKWGQRQLGGATLPVAADLLESAPEDNSLEDLEVEGEQDFFAEEATAFESDAIGETNARYHLGEATRSFQAGATVTWTVEALSEAVAHSARPRRNTIAKRATAAVAA